MIPPLLAIFAFPIVALILFKSLVPRNALIWTTLLGYLFLPTATSYDLPLLPAIDKDTMPALCAILLLLAVSPKTIASLSVQPGWVPRHKVIRALIFVSLAGALLTVLTNSDALVYGSRVIPGLRVYDGFSDMLGVILHILPLLLARKFLANEEGHRLVLQGLAIAGAIYSLPIIFELVMSPQLNRIVYGFFPHSWAQHIRNGGYRPLVFLHHGLWLGIFMSGTVLAAFACMRVCGAAKKNLYFALGMWLLLILVSVKTLGALMIAILLLPVVAFLKPRGQVLVAAAIAGCILLYPTLRGAGLVPTDQIVESAESIDSGRAASLRFRLKNEDILLAKANQRSLFGWGGWGRSRVYNEKGQDISVTDGLWVGVIGLGGWTGYIGTIGLLCVPILLLAFRGHSSGLTLTTSCLSLVLAGNLIDLIPNAGLTPVTWLLVGALCGRLELARAQEQDATGTAVLVDRRLRLTRFDPSQPARLTPGVPKKSRFTAQSSTGRVPHET